MARHLRAAIARVKAQAHASPSRLPVDVDQLARDAGHEWRDRKLTPAVTMRLFILQILHGNVAITALNHLGAITVQASSYCAARMRLPMQLFTQLFDAVSQAAADKASAVEPLRLGSPVGLLNGRRVLLADGTTFSTPDTPALRAYFGYAPGQREGCGFPIGKLLGVIDAITGAVIVAMGCPLFSHEAREMLTLHPLLRRGDVLVADRAFCSFLQFARLMDHGVDVVARLHQRRPTPALADTLQTWTRPLVRPEWMSESVWNESPAELTVRIVRYTVNRKGSRVRNVYVATTLLDSKAYPPETIARLYGHRWNIETCFNQMKTHARMNTLRCQTVEGVVKELLVYLIVWNLVRMTMTRFAEQAGVSPWRISFIDTLRCLAVLLQAPARQEVELLIHPDRPDRWEPRKLKRRIKEYDLLMESRQRLKAKMEARWA
jgi:Transposase DDE domain